MLRITLSAAILLFSAASVQRSPRASALRPPAAREIPTFENLHVDATELPQGWRLEDGLACVSSQPAMLFEKDLLDGVIQTPRHKDFQTIVGAGGRGSILYLDYAPGGTADATELLQGLLWGEDMQPSTAHPEILVRAGKVLVIVSFPADSPAGDWVCTRLRQRFGLRIPRFEELSAQLGPALEACLTQDVEAGLKFLRAHAAEFAGSSFAAHLEGELCAKKKDWAGSESAYRRALELDRTTDPLPADPIALECVSGLGDALFFQQRFQDAAMTLRDAARLAADLSLGEQQASSLYNCACSFSRGGKPDEALTALAESLALNPARKAAARKDADLAALRERPEFKKLVQ